MKALLILFAEHYSAGMLTVLPRDFNQANLH